MMTMEEDPKQRSSLLDSSIRELAEHPRSPLPNPSIRKLAGFPRGSLPSAGVQELAKHSYQLKSPEFLNSEASDELRRLAVELNRQLELQKQKTEDRGCGPTDALFGPQVVRSVPGCGPTSGFYEPQVVRPILEQEVHGSGPTDNSVFPVGNEWDTPSVVRPLPEHDQQNNAYGSAYGAYPNRTTNTREDSREVSEFYHLSRSGKEHHPTREQRRHCSNFSSEERTPDVQALYESFDSAYTLADFETSR